MNKISEKNSNAREMHKMIIKALNISEKGMKKL